MRCCLAKVHGAIVETRQRCPGLRRRFPGKIGCKNFANAAYRAVILNASLVNLGSGCLKLLEFCEKLPGKSGFVSFKTPVNYNRGFSISHNSGRTAEKTPRHINGIRIRTGIPANLRSAKSKLKSVS